MKLESGGYCIVKDEEPQVVRRLGKVVKSYSIAQNKSWVSLAQILVEADKPLRENVLLSDIIPVENNVEEK